MVRRRVLSVVLCFAMLVTSMIFGSGVVMAEETDPKEIIIDNMDEGFSKEGSWNTSTSRAGYYGENYFSAASNMGGSGATAVWTPTIETAGYYNIYVQHPQGGNDSTVADNAPYTIAHANGATVVHKSQRNSGGSWEFLACERFAEGSSGSVTLTLDSETGGAVMADAVRFVLVMPDSEVESIVIDNNEAVFVDSKWKSSTYRKGYYGEDYQSIAQDTADDHTTASATWIPVIENGGYYTVSVQHPEGGGDGSISDNVPYKIKHAQGESTVRLNQREKGMGGKWRVLGTFRFEPGTEGSIQISFDGVEEKKAIMADAVRLERVMDIAADDAVLEQLGTVWETVEDETASGGTYRTTQSGDNGSRLTHSFYVTAGGGYRLRFYKPAGLDVSGMSKEMTVQIDNSSYTVDLTSLQDGYNTVAFCSLDQGEAHKIEFMRSQDAPVFLDAIRLEYVGYSLYYTEFADQSADSWSLGDGWSMEGNTLTGDQGAAIFPGDGWKNISADFTFTTDLNGSFGLIVSGTEEEGWTKLEYDPAQQVFILLGADGTEFGRSGTCALEAGRTYTLQILSETPNLTFSLDGTQLIQVEGERSGNLGLYSAGALLTVASVGVDEAKGATEGTYTIRHDDPQQTIWGLGIEIQSDSIASGNQGLLEDYNSVPHDLTQSERDRLYNDMLKGFRYMRMAGGLYYRGTDEERKHLRERWDTQNEELAELISKSGIEGIDFEFWSPTPYFKASGDYRESNELEEQGIFGLKCFVPDAYPEEAANKEAFLQDFADTLVEDFKYLRSEGLPVIQFSLQNEPDWTWDTGYSHCTYTADTYYETVKYVYPTLKEAFPDLHIHADSLHGQYGKGSKKIKEDPELLQYVDAWTHHYMGSDSNVQIDSADYLNSNKGRDDIVVYNTEFEYLDGKTSDWRCINTAQSIMNWMTFENSPTWHWLHALKPLGNSEAEGYSLGFWRKPGDTEQHSDKYNHIKEGEWDYNYQNWNAIRGFLKYMPWDSVRYTVDEDEVRYDQRIMSWKTPEGKLVIALTNRSSDDYFQFNLDTGLDATFHGYQYTPQGEEEIELGTVQGSEISPMLPPLSIEFWVQEEDETMVMADSVVMGQTEADVAVGGETQLTAAVLPENAANKNIRWTSDDSTIASVDENGVVTGVKEGETTIIATAISGSGQFKAECIVKVGTQTEESQWRTLLKETIDTAEAIKEAGFDPNLIPAVKEKFEAALANAWAVYNDPQSTDEQLAAADSELIRIMQYLSFTADPTGLKEAIAHAEEVIASGQYLDDENMQAYKEALRAAKETLEDAYSTDTEYTEAVSALQEAETKLVEKPEVILDLSVLKHYVELAQAVQTNLSQYYDGAGKDAFVSALEAAEDILEKAQAEDEGITQEIIDEAAETLHSAIMGLRLIPDKDQLKDLLDEANSLDPAEYTEASAAVLRSAIAVAQAVYDDPEASVEEVSEAEALLSSALDGLEPAGDNSDVSGGQTGDNGQQGGSGQSNGSSGQKDESVPKTGDSRSAAVYAWIAVISSILVVGIYRRKRRGKVN